MLDAPSRTGKSDDRLAKIEVLTKLVQHISVFISSGFNTIPNMGLPGRWGLQILPRVTYRHRQSPFSTLLTRL